MKITCIDFETANRFHGSVCAVGVVVIEKGKITQSKNWLVKPHESHAYFEPFNITIHKITPEAVANSPEFDKVYEELKPYLENAVLVAHNAVFDMSVIKKVLDLYDIPLPKNMNICSCSIARKTWHDLENYKLNTVAKFLKHKFKHHDALEDAHACGVIIIEAMKHKGVSNILELAEKTGLKFNVLGQEEVKPFKLKQNNSFKKIDIKEIRPEVKVFNETHILYGKKMVFTGQLDTLTREKAIQKALNAGASVSEVVTKTTDYLVRGAHLPKKISNKESVKTQKAKQVRDQGGKIRIINERDFISFF